MTAPRAYFVYGTLRPGGRYWSNIAASVVQYDPAFVDGYDMWHMPDGYPAILPGSGRIFGDLIYIRGGREAAVARIVDDIEEYDANDPGSLYLRRTVQALRMRRPSAGAVPCDTYVFNQSRSPLLRATGIPVPLGDWREFIALREPERP